MLSLSVPSLNSSWRLIVRLRHVITWSSFMLVQSTLVASFWSCVLRSPQLAWWNICLYTTCLRLSSKYSPTALFRRWPSEMWGVSSCRGEDGYSPGSVSKPRLVDRATTFKITLPHRVADKEPQELVLTKLRLVFVSCDCILPRRVICFDRHPDIVVNSTLFVSEHIYIVVSCLQFLKVILDFVWDATTYSKFVIDEPRRIEVVICCKPILWYGPRLYLVKGFQYQAVILFLLIKAHRLKSLIRTWHWVTRINELALWTSKSSESLHQGKWVLLGFSWYSRYMSWKMTARAYWINIQSCETSKCASFHLVRGKCLVSS